jgi:hypothetical protein
LRSAEVEALEVPNESDQESRRRGSGARPSWYGVTPRERPPMGDGKKPTRERVRLRAEPAGGTAAR